MKKITLVLNLQKISLILLLISFLSINSYSRTYDGNEKIYLRPIAVSWWLDGSAKVGLKFKNSTNNSLIETPWLVDNDGGNIHSVTVPAGDWTHVIVSRHSTSPISDGNRWNQSGEIVIPATENYIQTFADNSSTATWQILKANYRSKGNGNWSSTSTWRCSFDSNWSNSWNYFDAHYVPNNNDLSVVIFDNQNVTLDQDAVISNLAIFSGATFTASDGTPRTLTITKSTSGSTTTLSNYGSWANGSGGSTVVFTGSPSSGDAVHTISGTIAFQNLTVNKTGGSSNVGASFGANSSLTGTLEIGTGGFISTDPPSGFYGTSAILKFNQGALATYDVNTGDKTWSTTEIPQNITVTSGTVRVNENRIATGSLIISSGAILEISAAKQLTVNTALTNQGTLNLLSSASGTATLKTPATIIGGGTYKVQQYLTNKSWYLTSPVSGTVTPTNLSRIQSYTEGDGVGNTWSASGTTMIAGKGYITTVQTSPKTVEFSGTINNGNISIPLTRFAASNANKYGFNLIGNPYTAYLDWRAVSAANSSKMPTSTMWYRTNVSGSWGFSTVNGSGVVSPANVSYMIPPMQAFWVRASTVGNSTLELTSNMVFQDNNTGNKLKVPSSAKTEPLLVRLQVSNSTNTDELVIYTDAQALNTFDQYDSPKMSNENANIPEISSIVDNESLVINGLNSLILDTALPLRFMTKTANTFTLKANQVSNLPVGVKLILSDYGNEFDLTSGAEYNFASDIADITNRFSIIFRSANGTTGICNPNEYKDILVYRNANNQICIDLKSELNKIENIAVYNTMGQKITETKPSKVNTIMNVAFETGVYFVKLNIDNKTITRKVIIK